MNKRMFLPLLLCFLFFSCKKDELQSIPEQGQLRSIEFNVFKNGDYSPSSFDGINAEVNLSISKENVRTGMTTPLWDTTISSRSIREFPLSASPLSILKQFGNIMESFESIRVSNVVRYRNGANQTWMNAKGETANFQRPIARFEVRI